MPENFLGSSPPATQKKSFGNRELFEPIEKLWVSSGNRPKGASSKRRAHTSHIAMSGDRYNWLFISLKDSPLGWSSATPKGPQKASHSLTTWKFHSSHNLWILSGRLKGLMLLVVISKEAKSQHDTINSSSVALLVTKYTM